MDNSPEYIEMCRKADEIQSSHEFKVCERGNDYVQLDPEFNPIRCIDAKGGGYTFSYLGQDIIYIWLPRQAQLQDMVFNKFKKITGSKNNSFIYDEMITSFYNFCFNGKTTQQWPWNNYTISMEQFWIAFVMHELFNRKWDGKEWTV